MFANDSNANSQGLFFYNVNTKTIPLKRILIKFASKYSYFDIQRTRHPCPSSNYLRYADIEIITVWKPSFTTYNPLLSFFIILLYYLFIIESRMIRGTAAASKRMICALVGRETKRCIRLPSRFREHLTLDSTPRERSISYPRLERTSRPWYPWPTLSTPFLSMLPFTLR